MKRSLYQLDYFIGNPIFEGFVLETAPSILGRESLDEDITPGYEISERNRIWTPKRLSSLWLPPKVSGRVHPFNDFPGIDMIFPAFSSRARSILSDFLEPNGELLPLDSEFGEYYFYNLTKVVDILDRKNSICEFWCEPPTSAIDINHFVFFENMLEGLSIFRIIELPLMTIVSEEFVQRVKLNNLNGFNFIKIWPFSKNGPTWQEHHRKNQQLQTEELIRMEKHTLVIVLILENNNIKQYEKEQIVLFENALDSELMIPSIESKYYGNYVGHDIVNNEYRIFLSCPDVDLLFQKIKHLINTSQWSGNIILIKRYGKINDPDAKEVVIQNF
jgi:hypothetical protein